MRTGLRSLLSLSSLKGSLEEDDERKLRLKMNLLEPERSFLGVFVDVRVPTPFSLASVLHGRIVLNILSPTD